MHRSFLNPLFASEFALNEAVSPIVQVKDAVDFEVVLVPVVGKLAAMGGGIYPEIPDAEGLEDEAEGKKLNSSLLPIRWKLSVF